MVRRAKDCILIGDSQWRMGSEMEKLGVRLASRVFKRAPDSDEIQPMPQPWSRTIRGDWGQSVFFMSARNVGHVPAMIAEATVVLIVGPKKGRKLENAGEEKVKLRSKPRLIAQQTFENLRSGHVLWYAGQIPQKVFAPVKGRGDWSRVQPYNFQGRIGRMTPGATGQYPNLRERRSVGIALAPRLK